MKLIVGLGNPGSRYDNTRHNIGFFMLDRLIREFGLAPFVKTEKFSADLTRLDDSEHHWFFAKPQTFMNESGRAVQALVKFYRLPLDQLLIIHDDLDLPFGELRPAYDRGPAGHNGVSSIIDALGSQAFHRLRIGIGSNRDQNLPAEDYVLQRFSNEEQKELKQITESVVAFVLKWTN